jgi:hypothetical protein
MATSLHVDESVQRDCTASTWRPIAHHWDVSERYAGTEWVKQLVQQNKDNFTEDYTIGVAIGAAKSDRLALCCDALMKWPHSACTLQHRFAQELAASTAKCTDTAVFDRLLRVCILVSKVDVPYMIPSRLYDRTSMLKCCEAMKKWHRVAECNDSCTAQLPLDQCAVLCGLQRNLLNPSIFGNVNRALIMCLVCCGQPMLHAYLVQHYKADVALKLVHTVTQKGRIDVLDHLYDAQLLVHNNALVRAVYTGAIEGERVRTVTWLQAHSLLQADTR